MTETGVANVDLSGGRTGWFGSPSASRGRRDAGGRMDGAIFAALKSGRETDGASVRSFPLRAPLVPAWRSRTLWMSVTAAVALHAVATLAALSVPWTSAPPVPLPSVVAVSIVVDAPEPLPESPVNRTQSVVSAAVAQPVDRADYVPAPPPIERAEAPPPESYPPLNPASVPVAQAAPQPRATLKPVREPAASVRPKAKQVAAASQSQPASESPVPPVEAAAPRAAPVDASPATAPMVVAAAAAPGRPAAAAVAAGPVLPPRPVAGLATNRKPDYPVAARSRHLQGHVVLRVQVSETGDPLAVEVVSSSGHPMLDDAALAAVRTWRFIPASRGGVEVAAPVEVPIDFRMAD